MKTQFRSKVTWLLGTKFIDTKGRKFEVRKVFRGYPENGTGYEIQYDNGWVLAVESGAHPQSRAGFVDLDHPEKLIVETVEKLDQFVENGHLKKIYS